MKHIFLLAGVAVLAYAVFKHHKAPVLAQEGAVEPSQLTGGIDGTSSPDLNDLSAPSLASGGGIGGGQCASIAPLSEQSASLSDPNRRNIQPVAGRQYSSFFHPLEL